MRHLLRALVVLLAVPAAAAGQSSSRISLEDVTWGTCVHFLVSPELVGKLLPRDAVPLQAGQGVGLPVAVQYVLREQADFAAWSPASLCLYRPRALEIEGRRIGGEGLEPETIGLLTIAARFGADAARSQFVAGLFTTNWRVEKSVETNRSAVDFETMRVQFGKAPKSDDDRLSVRIGRVTLVWDGHPAADSAAAGPVTQLGSAEGRDGKPWGLDLELRPERTRSMVGALLVQGKGDLAKALRASPVRFVGPYVEGGSGALTLHR